MVGVAAIRCDLAAETPGSSRRTSLTNPNVRLTKPAEHSLILAHGPVTIVVVDDVAVLLLHRAGHNGIASLTHASRQENLFVPAYAGPNLEHIHDGTGVA